MGPWSKVFPEPHLWYEDLLSRHDQKPAWKQVTIWAAKDNEVSRVPAFGLYHHLHSSSLHRSFGFRQPAIFSTFYGVLLCTHLPSPGPKELPFNLFPLILQRKPAQGSKEAPGQDRLMRKGSNRGGDSKKTHKQVLGARQIEGSLLGVGVSGHVTWGDCRNIIEDAEKEGKERKQVLSLD